MTDQQQQTPPPVSPAINATEAQTKIDTLFGDKAWTDRFMSGDSAAKNEFQVLAGLIADGGSAEDVVAEVMAGKGPQFGNSVARQMAVTVDHFRGLGIRDEVTKEFLSGRQVSPQEYQAVAALKRELMGDREFVAAYLGGDVKAQQRMTTIDAVLVNGVKVEA